VFRRARVCESQLRNGPKIIAFHHLGAIDITFEATVRAYAPANFECFFSVASVGRAPLALIRATIAGIS
jgi:hypothetical protein